MKKQAKKIAKDLTHYLFDYVGDLTTNEYDALVQAQKTLIRIANKSKY